MIAYWHDLAGSFRIASPSPPPPTPCGGGGKGANRPRTERCVRATGNDSYRLDPADDPIRNAACSSVESSLKKTSNSCSDSNMKVLWAVKVTVTSNEDPPMAPAPVDPRAASRKSAVRALARGSGPPYEPAGTVTIVGLSAASRMPIVCAVVNVYRLRAPQTSSETDADPPPSAARATTLQAPKPPPKPKIALARPSPPTATICRALPAPAPPPRPPTVDVGPTTPAPADPPTDPGAGVMLTSTRAVSATNVNLSPKGAPRIDSALTKSGIVWKGGVHRYAATAKLAAFNPAVRADAFGTRNEVSFIPTRSVTSMRCVPLPPRMFTEPPLTLALPAAS